tara:strand:- start:246 stop:755 length:510 start_codon:yes stop_codon:yes gene_type:complete
MANFAFSADTLTDGTVADAADVQDRLDELATHLNNASLIDNAALAKPEHLIIIGPLCPGDATGTLPGSSALVWKFAYKPTVALIPVQVDLYFGSGSGALELDIKEGSDSILNAVLRNDAADTITSTTSFSAAGAAIAADSTITFLIENTSSNDATHVSFSLTCKAEHTT